MRTITIINAYGQKNLGDAAIQESAISILDEFLGIKDLINLVTVDSGTYVKKNGIKPKIEQYIDPYGYAIATPKGTLKSIQKITRFIYILSGSLFITMIGRLHPGALPVSGTFSYIRALKSSDTVLGMGGGYYFTKRKYKDYFGLILTMLPIIISNIYNKRIIILPVTFGPFASIAHRDIAYNYIKKHRIIVRDYISLDFLKKIENNRALNAYYAPDLALFLKAKKVSLRTKLNSDYMLLTARDWFLELNKQEEYEKSLADFVDYIWQKEKIKTLFIPMAKNKYEDDDNSNARRIMSHIKHKNVFKIYNPKDISDLIDIVSLAKFSVCTRMHSAIISAIARTPFIAIGYGHKTKGFVESFGLQKWHIDINSVNNKKLIQKFLKLKKGNNYINYIKTLEIKNKEISKYKYLLLNDLKGV